MPSRPHLSTALRNIVIERAQGRCEYCQSRADFATETFAVDHIVPLSLGGKTESENLALACSGCNSRKYNRQLVPDPTDGDLVSLYNPHQQDWAQHFRWSEDYALVIGVTPTGRATVSDLKLYRLGLRNMRLLLYQVGKQPPQA